MTKSGAVERRAATLSWADRWNRLRTRLLGSARFQRWAAAFPLTRPIARRSANRLFDLCAGFVYTQVLYASVRSGLIDALAHGPVASSDLMAALDMPGDSARRLVDAAVALDLVECLPGGRYGLGQLGAALVGNPGVARMVEHHIHLYRDLADPLALLKGTVEQTELGQYWAYARTSEPGLLQESQVAEYSELMAASQSMIANEVLAAYPVHRHSRLLDAGGGQGAFLAEVALRAPTLDLVLFDLPPVVERARRYLAKRGIGDRVQLVGGDLFRDPLPSGCDIVSLVRIVHDHDDDEARAILRAARLALPAGGTLLLVEPMAQTPGSEAMGDAYFGFYLLAMGSGRPRSPDELKRLVTGAGFTQPRMIPTNQPLMTRIMCATVPLA